LNRSYKYRIYPNKKQIKLLERTLDLHRQLYNMALDQRQYVWRTRKRSLNYYDQANQVKELRPGTDFAFLNYSSMQRTLKRLDRAFAAFFVGGGYPRFKAKDRWASVTYTFGDGISFARDGRLRVQNVGNVRIFQHRDIPNGAKIKTAQIVRQRATGAWFVTFSLDLPDPELGPHAGDPVGVDLGVTTVAALSTGELIKAPRPLREAERELRVKQRRLSRRKRGSTGRKKAARQVGRAHLRVANQRLDFNHKLARRLVDEFSLIAVEDLNILGLSKSRLAKGIHDSSWGQLLSFLSYKAESAGSQVVSVDPRYTSQVCSRCGSIVPKSLSVRVHSCPDCGLVLDRDHNAAINILNKALRARTEPRGANVIGCDVRSPGSSPL
jgi:putative transposase